MSKPNVSDVVIAGAGPNGLAMALALGSSRLQRPLAVMVLDAGDPRARLHEGHDTRGSALTQATQQLLRALGLSDSFFTNLQEMRDIKVTDGAGPLSARPALLSFATDDTHRAAAAIVENRHLNAALLAAVDASPQIKVLTGQKLTDVTVAPGKAHIGTEAGDSYSAPLLIGADGRGSFVRSAAGLTVEGRSHHQVALTFTMVHGLPHGAMAEEHFAADGVFALLPLPGHRYSVVWAMAPERASNLMALPMADFTRQLQDQVGEHLGVVELEGNRQAYPLHTQLAAALTANRVALIGDAAHLLHPLAGLGLNLGFKDVAALADCVHDAVGRGEDLGGPAVLARYAQWRNFDTVSTTALINGMNLLFANDNVALKVLRDAGLRLFDRVPPIKSALMGEASGLTGDLPRLMRGLLP